MSKFATFGAVVTGLGWLSERSARLQAEAAYGRLQHEHTAVLKQLHSREREAQIVANEREQLRSLVATRNHELNVVADEREQWRSLATETQKHREQLEQKLEASTKATSKQVTALKAQLVDAEKQRQHEKSNLVHQAEIANRLVLLFHSMSRCFNKPDSVSKVMAVELS